MITDIRANVSSLADMWRVDTLPVTHWCLKMPVDALYYIYYGQANLLPALLRCE